MKARVCVLTTICILLLGAVSMSAQTCPPLTQGFWKNHQSAWADGSGMTLGSTFYTNAQLVATPADPGTGGCQRVLGASIDRRELERFERHGPESHSDNT